MAGRLIFLVTFAVIVNLCAFGIFRCSNNKQDFKNRREISRLQGKWESEDKQREQSQRQELQKKYGNTAVERIVNDPDMDINEALKNLARAFALHLTKASVSVEHFTDFTVTYSVVEFPLSEDQAQLLKKLFTIIDPHYVFELEFVRDDGKKKIIEQRNFLAVKDWEKATIPQIVSACIK